MEGNQPANHSLFMIPRWLIKRLWIFSCAFTLPSFEGHDLEGLEGHDNCIFFIHLIFVTHGVSLKNFN